jgi:hypothetical protein
MTFRDDGPGAGGGYITVSAPAEAVAGQPWSFELKGLSPFHSVLIELYGDNGGLFRLFPRGRDVMKHTLTPVAPGRMTVVIMGRDSRLRAQDSCVLRLPVHPAGAQPSAAIPTLLASHADFPEPMGVAKPPFALSPTTVGAHPADTSLGSRPDDPTWPRPGAGMNPADALERQLAAQRAALLARFGGGGGTSS